MIGLIQFILMLNAAAQQETEPPGEDILMGDEEILWGDEEITFGD